MSLMGSLSFGVFGFGGFRKKNAAGVSWSPAPNITKTTDGTYTVLTANGTCTVTVVNGPIENVDIMLVGRGGNSGPHNYGGAGGLVYATTKSLSNGSKPLSIGSNVTFDGWTALQGGPTGSTGSHDPNGHITAGRPGGSGGGTGRSGGTIGPNSFGGTATQPTQSQPAPSSQYGNPGFGKGGNPCKGGGGAGSGGPNTYPDVNGGNGYPISISGSPITYAAGSPSPSRFPGPGSSNPNTPGRGGGGGIPGTVIIRYPTP